MFGLKLTALQVKLIAYVLLAVAAALWFNHWLDKRDEARDTTANLGQAVRTGQAAEAIAGNAATAQDEADTLDRQVEAQRVEITHRYERLKDEDPDVRAAVGTRIPDRMRELARERRLARERLGGAAPGGEDDDAGEDGSR